jgi:hypothetical protein
VVICAYRFVVSRSEWPITFCNRKTLSAPAQIASCECVPGCVERAPWRRLWQSQSIFEWKNRAVTKDKLTR